MFKGNGPDDYVCVRCGNLLAEAMPPENMTKRVRVRCGRCDTVNVAVTDDPEEPAPSALRPAPAPVPAGGFAQIGPTLDTPHAGPTSSAVWVVRHMRNPKRTALRSRLALAATVALACLGALLGISLVLSSPGPAGAASAGPAVGSLEAAARPTPAHAHSRQTGVPGMSERQLRAFETATLGDEHAAEHAEIRRELRLHPPEPDPGGVERAQRAATVAAAAVGTPAEVGRWDFDATKTLPIVAIHSALLPTGKVMFFSYPQSPEWVNSAEAYLWDPASGEITRKDPPMEVDPKDGQLKPANIWCAGHTLTADGELVVFGGNLDFESGPTGWKGLDKVYTFDPFTEQWHRQPDMAKGRWYPTGVRMADGRIPITSGLDETGTNKMDEDLETFTPAATRGGTGSISLIGQTSDTDPLLPPTGGYYPHMFAMPSGRAFVVGPQQHQTWFLNSWTGGPLNWTEAPHLSKRRLWGTAVPLPGGTGGSSRIMMLGGSTFEETLPSNPTSEFFDETRPDLGWQTAPSMNIGRGHANTVLLPDGSMVEVGGGVGRDNAYGSALHAANEDQKQVELWDPATSEWRLGPAQAENRAYHSTALLLPDGRVMSAGDEWHGAGGVEGTPAAASDTAEIYEPPYLFKGPRPTIASAPSNIRVGSDFGVQTPDANVTRAVLVAPGSVTHAVDMNQRLIPLALTKRTGCVDLSAPPNVNAAPPGWYMLFLLNAQGVPSVAKFVRLRPGGDAPSKCSIVPEAPGPAESARPARPAGSTEPAGAAKASAGSRRTARPPSPG